MKQQNNLMLPNGNILSTVAVVDNSGNNAFPYPQINPLLIGNKQGQYPTCRPYRVVGRKSNINDVLSDLWEGPTAKYVFPSVGLQMAVASSSAADAAAGTGVRKVKIVYLNSSYVEFTEEVTLNGTTPVNMVASDVLRINSIYASAVGSGGVAAGNISVTNGGVTYAYIAAGVNSGLRAVFTVPDGYYYYVTQIVASSSSSGANHYAQITGLSSSKGETLIPGVFITFMEFDGQDCAMSNQYSPPILIPPRADVRFQAISDGSAAVVTASVDINGWLQKV